MSEIFDKYIKSRLDQHATDLPKDGAWQRFEAYRDLHEHHSHDTDDLTQTIGQDLKNHTVPFNESHWKSMEKRIQIFETRVKHIFISKFVELTAVLFIYLLFIHYPHLIIPQPKSSPVNQKTPSFAMQTSENHVTNSKLNAITITTYNQEAEAGIARSVVINNPIKVQESNANHRVHLSSNATKDQVSAIDNILDEEGSGDEKEVLQVSTHLNITGALPEQSEQAQDKITQITTLNPTDIPGIYIDEIIPEMALIVPFKMAQAHIRQEVLLSTYGSIDAILVNTPFDKVYSKASYYKEAINSSFGVNVSKRLQTLELGIGISYAQRKYNPEVIEEIYGVRENFYSQVTFNSISYDIVSVPVHVNYRFINKKTWAAYLMTTAVASLVADADYGIKDVVVMGRPNPDYNRSSEESRLEEKPFIQGFLHGDNIQDNYILSLGFGFGIEKEILKRTSIYIQPSYQRHIFSNNLGIGPNKDKIHTSSLQFGLKYKLK
ncbi:MAG: hypothetical protein LC107_00375 [Chitinophagales bacterium]|nr:hypothetical protein [Chitinophagales bacterium]